MPSAPLEATGERLVPDRQQGELVHAEHVARYRFAAQLAGGRRVLDAASGEGYGTAILAAGAQSVVGIEIDPTVVKHARAAYGLSFVAGDVAELPFEDGAFDLVVSFETIEHVTDAARVLAEFRRVLAGDGVLAISTPNKHEYLVDNEFHTREYTREEFAALLESRFPSVQLLAQHNWMVSAVTDAAIAAEDTGEARLDIELYKLAGIPAGGELYTVALCGQSPAKVPGPVAASAGTDEAHELARRLTSAEEAAESWHAEYLAAKQTAEDWHHRYAEAGDTAERWHEQYLAAERLATELRAAYDDTQAQLQTLYGSASWRLGEPLRRLLAALRGRRG